MAGEDRSHRIRLALPDEFAHLRAIELRADELFESVGIGPFVNDPVEDHLTSALRVLVAERPAVGFICLDLVDGLPHVWQLAVEPDHTRRGTGRALLQSARAWATAERFSAMTLTTFRDVPWNGPFYERFGFRVLERLTPGLEALRRHEREIGDDDFGPRVAMRLDL